MSSYNFPYNIPSKELKNCLQPLEQYGLESSSKVISFPIGIMFEIFLKLV